MYIYTVYRSLIYCIPAWKTEYDRSAVSAEKEHLTPDHHTHVGPSRTVTTKGHNFVQNGFVYEVYKAVTSIPRNIFCGMNRSV